MSKYFDELTALYTAKKASDIDKRLKEANDAAAARDEQNKRQREEQERKERDRQFEAEMRQSEAGRRQTEKEAEEQESLKRQESHYRSTIDKMSSEIEDMKVLLSLPESERADYLRRREEANKQKALEDERRQRDAEVKAQEEMSSRLLAEQEYNKKLDKVLNRFESEGIRSFNSEDEFAAVFGGRKQGAKRFRTDVFGDTFFIAGECVHKRDIDVHMTSEQLNKWMEKHTDYIYKRAAEEKHQEALAQSEMEKAIKEARIRRIRRVIGACLLFFTIYALWDKSYMIALGTLTVLVIMFWSKS